MVRMVVQLKLQSQRAFWESVQRLDLWLQRQQAVIQLQTESRQLRLLQKVPLQLSFFEEI